MISTEFFQFYVDPAEIIQTRYNESESHYEYYVHYEGHNRRLDEWVPRDRIMSSRFDMSDRSWKSGDRNSGTDLLADSSDRKITRNQKRRHDEINHIQKVYIYIIIKLKISIYKKKSTFFYCRHMPKWILQLLH